MEFLKFLRKEHAESGYFAIAMTVAAGILSGLMAGVVIVSAQRVQPGSLNAKYVLMFGVTLAAWWFCKRHTLGRNTTLVEEALEKIRQRVAEKIRHTDLEKFERIGGARIYAALNTDTLTLSQYTPFLINASSSLIMIAFALLIIGFLSKTALLLTIGVLAVSLVYYFARQKRLNKQIAETSALQTDYFEALNSLLAGFKELKMNSAKSDDFFRNRLRVLSDSMRVLKIKTGGEFNQIYLFAQSFSFILMGAILFLMPTLNPSQTAIVPQVVAIILFLVGPIGEVVGNVPLLAQCNNALRNINRLEDELGDVVAAPAPMGPRKEGPGFERIEMRDVTFSYAHPEGEQGFSVGPLDFTLTPGEVVFIVGGNGSGKSTFLKLFTSLYRPADGKLMWDGIDVSTGNATRYRNLFSLVLTDFHLFDRLYGLPQVDLGRAEHLLDKMHLSDVTQIVDGQVTNTKLSTGQRKRLALIVSLLEEKPIYVFDEWAADQDPEFRQYFYEVILPEMKQRGTTVLAATHDDRYFSRADRVLKMELGSFVKS